MRECCCGAYTRSEGSFPITAVSVSDRGKIAGRYPGLAVGQARAQQPGRLHGHAYPLGDDGVRLAGEIAREKNPTRERPADSRTNGPRGEPRTVELRRTQRVEHARA